MRAAIDANVNAVAVATGGISRDELRSRGAHVVLQDVDVDRGLLRAALA